MSLSDEERRILVGLEYEKAPTKEGYTFSGWSEIPKTMPAKDVVVTGTFVVNKYKLIYKVDGVEYKSYEIEYGKTITPEAAPTKEGYTFSGWSEIPKTMPARDVVVTGTFGINFYKLTYIVDGRNIKPTQLHLEQPSPRRLHQLRKATHSLAGVKYLR